MASPFLKGVFSDPLLCAAVEEIEALGLSISDEPHGGSEPYGVLTGHERSRAWLVPLRPRAVSVRSFAMVRPLRFNARAVKHAAAAAATVGLPWYGFGRRLHISGDHCLTRLLGASFTHCAFFSGTAGPHRKLVVQLMDHGGAIHGYAKVSRTPAVHSLLENEASVVREMHAADLRSASVPEVLLYQKRSRTAMLATEPLGSSARCVRRLTRMHLDFLGELAERTASRHAAGASMFPGGGSARLEELASNLSPDWRGRLQRQLDFLRTREELAAPAGLSHGDFTPGNVFSRGDRLCVIDWEYAGRDYPADYDLLHFLFSLANLEGSPPVARCNGIYRLLIDKLGRTPDQAHARLIAYLCARTFFLAGRRLRHAGMTLHWEGERELALMLDALSHAKSPSAIRFDLPAGER
ncbi:MAG TPA: phosphotransferase [Rhodanobacteraceae bacterium]